MAEFYLVFLCVMLAGVAARDQVLVADLVGVRGQQLSLLVIAIIAACATAAFAAWAATVVIPTLNPRAQQFFAALGLALAGLESLVIVPRRAPREPTLSLGATTLALTALQLIDSARFVIFALAVATTSPLTAGLAGALAGSLVVAAGWLWPALARRRGLASARRGIGLLLLLAGCYQGLTALDLL